MRCRTASGDRAHLDSRIDRCKVSFGIAPAGGIVSAGCDGAGMSPELQESRAALILIAVVVVSVLIFGAVTLFSQIG
ncbi:hypothetical protein MKK55_11980 [Methylobacterium sp. J-059]|uniref:hypothetical protein n=1 Tax=Methylobacterium sp. J-059 TaxID=2836643 RepID=UPI001FBA9D8F|nr:hypothetical protein [Methylobacterium sp. J-059]MCJ2039655.1 hypothetical protein [Methylobacterium sp. J-059]